MDDQRDVELVKGTPRTDPVPPPVSTYPLQQYPPANGPPGSGYAPVVIGQNYPPAYPGYPPPNPAYPSPSAPQAAPQLVVMHPNIQTQGVTVEGPMWDFYRSSCAWCVRLQPPQGDQFSVLAPAAVSYSPFIRARMCHRLLLPFLVTGDYVVNWPGQHGLAAFTNQQELQDTCDQVRLQSYDQLRRVTST